VGVATGEQFLMQLSDIVTACFPAFAEKGEMGIKMSPSWAWLLFGKRVKSPPTRDRGMAYPNLIGKSHLREAELA
jgi:hypothetical protein